MTDGPPLARPFLGRGSSPPARPPTGGGSGGDRLVRAYAVTGGRTRADGRDAASAFDTLRFESMVSITTIGRRQLAELTFERKKIAALCHDPLSVAEISAELHLPIGVVRVLVADLLTDGLLQRFDAPHDVSTDISLMRELIDGIRNL